MNDIQLWAQMAFQIPIVIAFIWFTLEINKRYQASMDKRDEAYLEMLQQIATKLELHDSNFKMAVARMEERTRPLPKRRKESTSPQT